HHPIEQPSPRRGPGSMQPRPWTPASGVTARGGGPQAVTFPSWLAPHPRATRSDKKTGRGMAISTIKERPYVALILLTAIGVVGFIDRIIMNVLAEPLKVEFQLSDTQLGIVNGLAFAVLNVVLA